MSALLNLTKNPGPPPEAGGDACRRNACRRDACRRDDGRGLPADRVRRRRRSGSRSAPRTRKAGEGWPSTGREAVWPSPAARAVTERPGPHCPAPERRRRVGPPSPRGQSAAPPRRSRRSPRTALQRRAASPSASYGFSPFLRVLLSSPPRRVGRGNVRGLGIGIRSRSRRPVPSARWESVSYGTREERRAEPPDPAGRRRAVRGRRLMPTRGECPMPTQGRRNAAQASP